MPFLREGGREVAGREFVIEGDDSLWNLLWNLLDIACIFGHLLLDGRGTKKLWEGVSPYTGGFPEAALVIDGCEVFEVTESFITKRTPLEGQQPRYSTATSLSIPSL